MKHDPRFENLGVFILLTLGIVALLMLVFEMAYGNEYYNLDDLTTDQYVEKNEGLQPDYDQTIAGPNISPLECSIERVVPLSTFLREQLRSDGTTWYYFDTNGDGIFDVTMTRPADDNKYPSLYFFDRDYIQGDNGPKPEIGYNDVLRDGTCGDIRVYWLPSFKIPPFDSNRHDGEPADCVTRDCDKPSKGVL